MVSLCIKDACQWMWYSYTACISMFTRQAQRADRTQPHRWQVQEGYWWTTARKEEDTSITIATTHDHKEKVCVNPSSC